MNPTQNPQPLSNNERIEGEPLELEVLLSLARIDTQSIASALLWWEEHASEDWKDVLEKQPVD